MTDKIDFSQLANEDDSLISWEELFPEYAIGGETFTSGKNAQAIPQAKSETQKAESASTRATISPKQQAPSSQSFTESSPPVSPNKKSMEFLEVPELPDIPSFTDDVITVLPEEQAKGDIPSFQSPSSHSGFENDWIDKALTESDQIIAEASQSSKNQDFWAARFNQLNFPGMDLMAVSYFGSFTYDMLEQHMLLKRVTRDFVRLLSYNYTMDLRAAGVSEEGIFYMKKGKIPENFTVHLKYPPEYGGTIDFNNLVFMQDKPFHDMIHSYLDEQILTPTGVSYPPLLYVPTPVGKIYVPFGMFTGSGGKNKQDRSVYAGFSKAAFDKIALKAMPGR